LDKRLVLITRAPQVWGCKTARSLEVMGYRMCIGAREDGHGPAPC
jgi:hypothetical protein